MIFLIVYFLIGVCLNLWLYFYAKMKETRYWIKQTMRPNIPMIALMSLLWPLVVIWLTVDSLTD